MSTIGEEAAKPLDMQPPRSDGGPAFPSVGGPEYVKEPGMTLRDWFAGHCPDRWLEDATPRTVGAMRDTLIARGLIPASRRKDDPMSSYTRAETNTLSALLRYDYADAMLAARGR